MRHPQQLFYVPHAYIKRQKWSWSKGKEDWGSVREALPDNWATTHMANGPYFGTYFVLGDRCHAAMIDIDDHDKKLGWSRIAEIADDLLNAMDGSGLVGHPFRSRGGHGINIWMIWEKPQQAAGVRAAIRQVLALAEYREAAGVIEVFPKQDNVPEGELGNAASLPRVPLDPWSFEDCASMDWTCSEPVAEVDIEDIEFKLVDVNRRTSATPAEIDEVLENIPNAGDKALDYDQWVSVIAAVKLTGGTIEQAMQWSEQSDKHDESELKKKWRSFKRNEGGTVADFSTLVKLANIHGGYKGTPVVLDAFPTADVIDLNGAVVDGAVDVTYRRIGGRGRYANCYDSNIIQLHKCITTDPAFPWVLTFDEFLSDRLLHDKMTNSFESLEDHHVTRMRMWFEENGWEPVGKEAMRDVINMVARDSRTNIAKQWAEGLVWDGVDRFDECIKAMGMEHSEYARAVVEYQWTAHAARALEPGHQADSIIVLISEEQGMGKSSMIKALAPKISGIGTERDTTIERLLKEEDAARSLRGALVANMDEMRNFSKREAAEAKAALSRTHESYIPKFIETRTTFGRQCLIYATNNKLQFLDDETGNRRYHTLPVGKIDVQWFIDHRDQLWAQGVTQFRTSGVAWQRAAELAKDTVAEYEVEDDWEPIVAAYLEIEAPFVPHITSADVLTKALNMKIADINRPEQTRVGKVMKRLGWKKKQLAARKDGSRPWVYLPPKQQDTGDKGSEVLDW
ncbi:MAG: VapE domain-containing protein [Fluviibacter phosphoraccumulans]